VGPRGSLDGFWRRKNSLSVLVFEPLIVQPVAGYYTNYILLKLHSNLISLTATYSCAAHEPVHINGCDPSPKRTGHP